MNKLGSIHWHKLSIFAMITSRVKKILDRLHLIVEHHTTFDDTATCVVNDDKAWPSLQTNRRRSVPICCAMSQGGN